MTCVHCGQDVELNDAAIWYPDGPHRVGPLHVRCWEQQDAPLRTRP